VYDSDFRDRESSERDTARHARAEPSRSRHRPDVLLHRLEGRLGHGTAGSDRGRTTADINTSRTSALTRSNNAIAIAPLSPCRRVLQRRPADLQSSVTCCDRPRLHRVRGVRPGCTYFITTRTSRRSASKGRSASPGPPCPAGRCGGHSECRSSTQREVRALRSFRFTFCKPPRGVEAAVEPPRKTACIVSAATPPFSSDRFRCSTVRCTAWPAGPSRHTCGGCWKSGTPGLFPRVLDAAVFA